MTVTLPAVQRVTDLRVSSEVWRPVQYLGSKLRAVDAIVEAVDGLRPGAFWDAFAGSSVVSQAAANAGLSVFATDTQRFSVDFAVALLGVGATVDRISDLPQVVDALFGGEHPDGDRWDGLVALEDRLLQIGAYDDLVRLYRDVPQRWRQSSRNQCSSRFAPLTTTFAGTYLSLGQAVALDRARWTLTRNAGDIDPWTKSAALTALCNAASEAVHSAGKHFAQPMQAALPGADNYNFVRARSLKDRSISVRVKASLAARQIAARAPADGDHEARPLDVLSVKPDSLKERGVSVVYADPPYTAQQYSRFYHVLETLALGESTDLQTTRGSTPKGLYPADRYMSPFCSRRQAPAAFECLVSTASGAGADLVLSYSTTGAQSGNHRTIGASELIRLVEGVYGKGNVSVVDLKFGYRQFNHASRRTESSGTREILIVGVSR